MTTFNHFGGSGRPKKTVFKNGVVSTGYSIEPNINGTGTAVYDASSKTWKCHVTGTGNNPVSKTGILIKGLREDDFVFVKLKNINLPSAAYSYFGYGALTGTWSNFPDNAILRDTMYIADTVDKRASFWIYAQYWAVGAKASFEIEEVWVEKIEN